MTKPAKPQTTSERVQALRARRMMLGLTRLEVYAHPEDHPGIKKHAEKLALARQPKS